MPTPFSDIPNFVIDHVRGVFSAANALVPQVVAAQPSLYEESFDHILIMELTANTP